MQQSENKNATKNSQKIHNRSLITVNKETAKILQNILAKANNKKYGRRIKSREVVSLALSLIDDAQIQTLMRNSLNWDDREQIIYKAYLSQINKISWNEFKEKLMRGELADFIEKNLSNL